MKPYLLKLKDNYTQYIQFPDHLNQILETGKIGLANFSDCIRIALLAKYGGLWLDATIFVSEPIPEAYFSYPLFTGKGPIQESDFVSNYRWTGFCMGGWKENIFYRYLADAFDVYWSNHDYSITYLYLDYIIKTGYDHIPAIRQLLDELPENNTHRDDLYHALVAGLPADSIDTILKNDTCLYKLSWKVNYPNTTNEGTPSIYSRFLKITE